MLFNRETKLSKIKKVYVYSMSNIGYQEAVTRLNESLKELSSVKSISFSNTDKVIYWDWDDSRYRTHMHYYCYTVIRFSPNASEDERASLFDKIQQMRDTYWCLKRP